jgi:hypothetical protein
VGELRLKKIQNKVPDTLFTGIGAQPRKYEGHGTAKQDLWSFLHHLQGGGMEEFLNPIRHARNG